MTDGAKAEKTELRRVWANALMRKFPPLDVTWPEALQARWWQSFWRLLAFSGEEPWR